MQIKFNDSETVYEVTAIRFKGDIAILSGGNLPQNNTSGFQMLYNSGEVQADYSDYIYKYNVLTQIEGTLLLTSNPEKVETEDNPAGRYFRAPTAQDVAQIEKQEQMDNIKSRIAEIDAWFLEKDYIGIKIATGRATTEGYAGIIAQMEGMAQEKDTLLLQLRELEE